MPYSGGSSTIAGGNYQNWFLALQCAYVFFERDMIVLPEAPKKDNFIDDIKVILKSRTTYFNVKLSPPSSSLHWTLSNLNTENILEDFLNQFIQTPDATLYLVSQSNCYLISEVFRRASNAFGEQDIEHHLESKACIDLWNKTKNQLELNDYNMIQFARNVRIKTIPQEEIQLFIKHRFLNVSEQSRIAELLLRKSSECAPYKTKISKELINSWFLEDDIKIRT
jgi:hypothetical protein